MDSSSEDEKQIRLLREQVIELRHALYEGSGKDLQRLEDSVAEKLKSLEKDLEKLVTIDRYRPIEWLVLTGAVALVSGLATVAYNMVAG